jgi:hypothetical protein
MRLFRRTSVAVVALAAAMTASAVANDDALASTQFGAQNPSRLGTADYYRVQGSSNFYGSTMLIPGPTVRRSRAYSGSQKVVVSRWVYSTYPTNWGELYNTWTLAASKSTSAIISPGYRRTWSNWTVSVNPFSNYRVVYKVSYYRADGSFLSSIYTDYRHTSDYQCNTGNCSVLTGRDGRASMLLTY